VRLGSVDLPPTEETYRHAGGGTVLYWEGIGRALVKDGREITVQPLPGADEKNLRLCLLGPAFGTLLHQAGYLVLHASSVCIGGSAVALLGESGSGKSTLASALCLRGHALVSDDISAVDSSGWILPGLPQIKLYADSSRALGLQPGPAGDKHPYRPSSLQADRVPLSRIYALGQGPALKIEPVSPHATVGVLLRHSYCRRLLTEKTLAAHFALCARVADRTVVSRLILPPALSALPEAARLLERNA
jgi:hypothetical protein